MAIDGVKIIDSVQGYDIYNEVVGRYRDGEHVTNIIKDILDAKKDYCQTDFYTGLLSSKMSMILSLYQCLIRVLESLSTI